MESAVGTLCGYAFLTRREGSDLFDMHSLVHLATRAWIQRRGDSQKVAMNALAHFKKVFIGDQPEKYKDWGRYLPHALRLVEEFKDSRIEDKYDLFERVADCLDHNWRFKEAVKYYEEVCSWRRENLPEEDLDRLTIEHALAIAYMGDGRKKDGIKLLEHVLAMRTILEENHI